MPDDVRSGRHEVPSVVQVAAVASLVPAIEGAPVRAALEAPRYVKGQRVIVTPELCTVGGMTVCGLAWRGAFVSYEAYGRALVLQDGEHSPFRVPAREVTADVAPPEHVTRVFTVPGGWSRAKRAGYDPTLDVVACVTCSCGWSATAPGNDWGACVGWGRRHVERAQAGPRRVWVTPYVPAPRVFAMEPVVPVAEVAESGSGRGFESVAATPRLAIEGGSVWLASPGEPTQHREERREAVKQDQVKAAAQGRVVETVNPEELGQLTLF